MMLRALRYFAYASLLATAVIIGTAIYASQEESLLAAFYEMAFGSPDLGPIDFETFTRGTRPNSALACPKDFCKNAVADFDPGIYPVSDELLRDLFTTFVLSQPDVAPVYRHAQPGLPTQDRYIQRTRLMQFPDTINVRFIPLSENTSTLAIHSRSQIGQSDLGVNLKRIRAWTDKASLEAK
jgi:uncharacterized protein (DUF1499 family)